jgi:hypothetical protein
VDLDEIGSAGTGDVHGDSGQLSPLPDSDRVPAVSDETGTVRIQEMWWHRSAPPHLFDRRPKAG